MLKKLSENKSQVIVLVLMAVVVLARNLVTLFSKGNPGTEILIFCIAMSLLYVFHFFKKFPTNRAELFKGEGLIGIICALAIFLAAFTRHYITHDFCLAMFALFGMILCATDIRLMPVNAVAALALSVINGATSAFTSIPFAIAVSFAVVLPSVRGAELWKKLVFAATQISNAVMLGYNIYQLRFNFSFHTALSYLLTTVILALFAALFVALAVLSLRSRKAAPARKRKKAVEEVKPRYNEAFAYALIAVFALLFTLHESRVVMAGIVGVLTSIFVLSKNTTAVKAYADKTAAAIGGVADKVFSASDEEE